MYLHHHHYSSTTFENHQHQLGIVCVSMNFPESIAAVDNGNVNVMMLCHRLNFRWISAAYLLNVVRHRWAKHKAKKGNKKKVNYYRKSLSRIKWHWFNLQNLLSGRNRTGGDVSLSVECETADLGSPKT
jgi:hypothetical protein